MRHGLQLGDSRSADVGPSARRSGSKVRLRATAAVAALSPACRGSMAARSPSGMSRALAARIEEHDDRRTVIDALCATSALRSDRAASTPRPTHATPPYVLCARHCGRAARSTARSVANQAATSSPPARAAMRCRTAPRPGSRGGRTSRLGARGSRSVHLAGRSPSGEAIFGVRRATRSVAQEQRIHRVARRTEPRSLLEQ